MKYLRLTALAIALFFSAQNLQAQSTYIKHTLKEGESLSALAKEYNTSVGDIMRINGMHADTKLAYGSIIKIPSTQKQTADVSKQTAAASKVQALL